MTYNEQYRGQYPIQDPYQRQTEPNIREPPVTTPPEDEPIEEYKETNNNIQEYIDNEPIIRKVEDVPKIKKPISHSPFMTKGTEHVIKKVIGGMKGKIVIIPKHCSIQIGEYVHITTVNIPGVKKNV